MPPRQHQPWPQTGIDRSTLPSARKRPLDSQAEAPQRKRVRQGLDPRPSRQQLVEAESRLSRSEAQMLEREGRNFGSRLRARTLTPPQLMDLVSGNILARRNGHGQALPFLSSAADPGFNTGRLISYLDQLLSHQQRRSVNTRHDEWGDCLDLAVHYLVKTGWFDQASTTRLATVANRLAKFASRPAALEGIAWLAAGLHTQAVRELPGMEFAHYANACSKNPDSTRCGAAVVRLCQRLIDDPPLLDSLDSVNTCLVLNAASKWPQERDCHEAALRIFEGIETDDDFRSDLLANAQSLCTVLNAASKWPRDATCRRVASSLAKDIAKDGAILDRLMKDRFQITLNALATWPEDDACREAVVALAGRMTPAAVSVHQLDWAGWQEALHAMSVWPKEPACQAAAKVLAKRLLDHRGMPPMASSDAALALAYLGKWSADPTCAQAGSKLAAKFGTGRDVSSELIGPNLVGALNGLSQWPDDPACRQAGHRLARRIHHDTAMVGEMSEQSVSVALAALARWPADEPCRLAKHRLASRIARDAALVGDMTRSGVCTSLVALGSWPDDPTCQQAVLRLARRLKDEDELVAKLSAQQAGSMLHTLGKWPDEEICQEAQRRVARLLVLLPELVDEMSPTDLALSLNAVGHRLDDKSCSKARSLLASRIADDPEVLGAMQSQQLAMSLNAVTKSLDDDRCCEGATVALLESLGGENGRPWHEFDTWSLSVIANATARLQGASDDLEQLAKEKLTELADHLDTHRQKIERANEQAIGLIFKALSRFALQRPMRPLCRPVLARVQALLDGGQLRDAPLEALGSLCMGLVPVARSPELKKHRKTALDVLNQLQPIVAHKIDRYVKGHREDKSRCPGLNFYQVLKTYSVVANQWKPKNVDGDYDPIQERKEELEAWVNRTAERTEQFIQAELGDMADNLLGQIEAGGDVLDALDLRLLKNLDKITTQQKPTRIDLAAKRREMAGPPRPVDAAVGATTHILVDPRGKELKFDDERDENGERPYSFYAHLTGQPLVEVKLPDKVGAFLLARTFKYRGEQWRFDMAAGPRMTKGKKRRPEDILNRTPKGYGVLPAVRYADSAPGSDFMKLLEKIAPLIEDHGRIQRMLLEMVSSRQVSIGTTRIGWFKDVPGSQHPFRFSFKGKPIELIPNDGVCFIKWEAAMKIPEVRETVEAWYAKKAGTATEAQLALLERHRQKPNTIAAQALTHFPRNEAAIEESTQHLIRELDAMSNGRPETLTRDNVDKVTLNKLLVNGGIRGVKLRAVCSADGKTRLTSQKSAVFDQCGGDILVGKAPYDKENLLPIKEENVATVANGDATAEFLSEDCFAMQFTLAGFDDDSDLDDPGLLHSKGMAIILPPGCWSDDHPDIDMAGSVEDLKTWWRWVKSRNRNEMPSTMTTTGCLKLKEMLLPGDLGSLPIEELRRRDMDCDGDDFFAYAGVPELTKHITQVTEERNQRRRQPVSYKFPKTAEPAVDEQGRYQAGRGKKILDAQAGDKLVGESSTAAIRFLSQPDDIHASLAEDFVFGTYDGAERDLRNGVRKLLRSGQRSGQEFDALLALARQGIDTAHMPEAKAVAKLLYEELQRWGDDDGTTCTRHVPDIVGDRFDRLELAYMKATTTAGRIQAILDNYPVLRLSHKEFPDGQPGWIKGEPELTGRNLFTMAVKAGTDASKTDVGTKLFLSVMECYQAAERRYPDRVKVIPHTKQTATLLRDDRFDPDVALSSLKRMPTMAAGIMQANIEVLREKTGLLPESKAPIERVTITPADIKTAADDIALRSRDEEPAITQQLGGFVREAGGRLAGMEHKLKSTGSLQDKYQYFIAQKGKSLDEATASIPDAIRYAVVLDFDAFTDGYRQLMARLDENGFRKTHVDNHFMKPRDAFSAVTAGFRAPSGQRFEVQFHTPKTFELKEQFHDLYKQSHKRRLEGASAAEIRDLMKLPREAFREAGIPPGCDEIDDWSREDRSSTTGRGRTAPARAPARVPPGVAPQVKQLADNARVLEKNVTPVLQDVVTHAGGRLHGADSDAWTKHIFKNDASLARKVQLVQRQQGLTAEQAAAQVRDALRYVVKLEAKDFGSNATAILDGLKHKGMEVTRVHNGFTEEDSSYAGLNVNLRLGNDEFEVQFHTPASLKNKFKTHKDYEDLRRLPSLAEMPESDDAADQVLLQQRNDLLQKLREKAAAVPRPVGAELIASFG